MATDPTMMPTDTTHRNRRALALAAGVVACALGGVWMASLAGCGQAQGQSVLDARRQHVAALAPAEKEALRRKFERFEALDPQEKQRLRELCRQVEADPQAAELKAVLGRYGKWLASLAPLRRQELLELQPQARVQRIKSMIEDQTERDSKRLAQADQAALVKWMEQMAIQHESQLIELVPVDRRGKMKDVPANVRARMLMFSMWWRWQGMGPGGRPALLKDDDLAGLRTALSADARQRLEGKPPAEQWKQVSGWVRQIVRQQMSGGKGFGLVSEEELARFFEHDLNSNQRDYLLSLPADEMQRELRRLYLSPGKGPDEPSRWPEYGPRGKMSDPQHKGKRPPGPSGSNGPGMGPPGMGPPGMGPPGANGPGGGGFGPEGPFSRRSPRVDEQGRGEPGKGEPGADAPPRREPPPPKREPSPPRDSSASAS